MLDKGICVFNFDNSVTCQRKLILQYPTEIIDFSSLASSARLYFPSRIRKKISNILGPNRRKYPVFLGSGDFHHISEILTSKINEPFSLVVFDFHPDWDILPPHFACGAWVAQALKNKNIVKCVLIGMGSDDLSFPALQTANLGALKDNRLEIYPYKHKLSRVYFRSVPSNHSFTSQKSFFSNKISWRQLEKEDLTKFTLELISRLPAKKIYISIDKDCLKKDFALTNWEEGFLHLDQLLTMIRLLRENLDIIGLDVTGDYSIPMFTGNIKAAILRFDHPKKFTANNCSADLILAVNQQANLSILQEIFS